MLARGVAPGKLILLGEHAVVYGHRAIAAAAPLTTAVTLRRRPGPSSLEAGAPSAWPALALLVPPDGVGVTIDSSLPMGCGMGSSAALAVATVRALAQMEGREASFEECFERAFTVERAFHGTPSGVDHAVSAAGGVVAFRKGSPPALTPLSLATPLWITLVDTGPPIASTAQLVAAVRARQAEDTDVAAAIEAIGVCVEEAVCALEAGALARVGGLMRANHQLLQQLGVSTPPLDAACDAMMAAGAWGAKLSGAGGGGVAFGLAPDEAAAHAIGEALRPSVRSVWALRIG